MKVKHNGRRTLEAIALENKGVDLNKLDEKFNKALIVIRNLKINKGLIATHLGISLSCFSGKISGYQYEVFTTSQKQGVLSFLREYRRSLAAVA